jgi:hypothetical protein
LSTILFKAKDNTARVYGRVCAWNIRRTSEQAEKRILEVERRRVHLEAVFAK